MIHRNSVMCTYEHMCIDTVYEHMNKHTHAYTYQTSRYAYTYNHTQIYMNTHTCTPT